MHREMNFSLINHRIMRRICLKMEKINNTRYVLRKYFCNVNSKIFICICCESVLDIFLLEFSFLHVFAGYFSIDYRLIRRATRNNMNTKKKKKILHI